MKDSDNKNNTTLNFIDDFGNEIPMEVLARAEKDGREFLLVTDPEEEDNAYILEAVHAEGETVTYEAVEDDDTLRTVGDLFAEVLEDIDIEYEEEDEEEE
ncbi:MAG: DUF1292 domain-containing protein [Lachnospiraceae bacterium]|nr:DUF1292 domain-containing protein [Lachnospiraceae bacterium]